MAKIANFVNGMQKDMSFIKKNYKTGKFGKVCEENSRCNIFHNKHIKTC